MGKKKPKSMRVWPAVKPFINGGASGMLAACVIQPIDMIKGDWQYFRRARWLRLQIWALRVYFPKWYPKGLRSSPTQSGAFVSKFVNLDFKSYLRFLNWMPEALKMPELELIDHAGLDSAVYLRIYLLGLKIFVPMTFIAWAIMVPVNWTNDTLQRQNVTYSEINKLSISNIPLGSHKNQFLSLNL